MALRISGSLRSGEMWRKARRSCATRRCRRSASASGRGTIINGVPIVLAHGQQALLHGLVAWPQQHLGALGAEHLAGVLEEGGDRRVELGRVLEDPARLVEQLESLVLLALRDVRAIGEEHRQQRDHEQGQQQRVQPQHRDGQQREARVGDRHQPAELDHLGQLLVLRGAAGHRDRGRDRERAEDRGARRRGERGHPVPGVRDAVGGLEQVEHGQRRCRGEREVGQVEGQLQRRLAVDEERGPGPQQHRQEVVVRGQQEEADDGRELAQRERVLLAPEVDVDHLELGREERRRHQVPRDDDGRLKGRLVAQEHDVQEHRQGEQQGREQGDPERRRHAAQEPAARVRPTLHGRADDARHGPPLPGVPVRVEHLALHSVTSSGRTPPIGEFYAPAPTRTVTRTYWVGPGPLRRVGPPGVAPCAATLAARIPPHQDIARRYGHRQPAHARREDLGHARRRRGAGRAGDPRRRPPPRPRGDQPAGVHRAARPRAHGAPPRQDRRHGRPLDADHAARPADDRHAGRRADQPARGRTAASSGSRSTRSAATRRGSSTSSGRSSGSPSRA